jgi:hypothetical protein
MRLLYAVRVGPDKQSGSTRRCNPAAVRNRLWLREVGFDHGPGVEPQIGPLQEDRPEPVVIPVVRAPHLDPHAVDELATAGSLATVFLGDRACHHLGGGIGQDDVVRTSHLDPLAGPQ